MVVTLQHIWKENYIMSDFKTFGLPDYVIDALQRMNITTPTPIQAEAIPEALKGHDILGSAQTGTGKTLAYIAPLCVYLLEKKNRSAVVLAPTRELAIQVRDMVEKIIGRSQASFKTALLIGGDPMSKQLIQLRKKPQLIIGTPGRINDHLNRQSLALDETQFLVLDETDRMLDMGFSEQLDTIVEAMHPERQTLMFSATMPANIVRISKRYLKDPKRITIGSTTTPVEHITQDVIHTAQSEKFDHLLRELETREGSVIVFVKTKVSCEDIKERLQDANHFAEAIHGDLHQRKRERVVRAFRSNKSRIMVATDVAARGLDVPHVRHVINYDLPQCPEDYIHRIGRTGRAGATGSALCLLSSDDRSKWRAIHNLMNPGKPFSFPKIPGDDRSSQGPKGRGFDRKRSFSDRDMDRQDRFKGKSQRFERSERSDRFERRDGDAQQGPKKWDMPAANQSKSAKPFGAKKAFGTASGESFEKKSFNGEGNSRFKDFKRTDHKDKKGSRPQKSGAPFNSTKKSSAPHKPKFANR